MSATFSYVLTTRSKGPEGRGKPVVHKTIENASEPPLEQGELLAVELGEDVDIHAHNEWWSPVYTCLPDGRIWRHASGRKQGWVK